MTKTKTIIFSISLTIVAVAILLIIGGILSAPNQQMIGPTPRDIPIQKVSFLSRSGSTLSGWYIPGQKKKGGILLMHGVRSNRLQMADRARFLNKEGYSILLFDFQAHGESLGDHITFGHLESLDANAGYSYLESRLVNKSIGVIGVSLGGASTVCGEVHKKADALVLESVYPTLKKAVSNRIINRIGSIGGYLSPLLIWQIKPRLGFDPDELAPINYLSEAKGAVFVLAGTDDKHTTLVESKNFFQNAKPPKLFWPVKGAAHVDLHKFNSEEYQYKILEFFKRHLK